MKHIKYILSVIALVVGCSYSAFAQKKVVETVIKGNVYESTTGKPLSGAQIKIPGITSVISDEKGAFELKKIIVGAVIQVSAPGFTSKSIPVINKKHINVWLLDETFKSKYEDVATPFDDVNASRNTSAISTYENREDYLLGATSIESVLQGKVNGLNSVIRSGAPGAGSNLFLNGMNTLNINSQPLIVVDGIIYENQPIYSLIGGNTVSALSDIDIKDIDKVTVLKNGASIYGSKGANGVILINTLRAKNTATRINFYAYTGVNFEPNTKYKMLDAWSYKNYLTDMLSNKGLSTGEIQELPYINSEKPVVENWGVSGNKDYYRYNQSTNWQDEVFNSSLNSNYHVNITGGNDAALYAISVGYLGNGGSVSQTSFSRYSTRVNARISMTEWFKLNASMSFVYSERNLSFQGLNRNFNPVFAGLLKAPFTTPYVYNVLGEKTPNLEDADIFNISNPNAIIDNSITLNNRFRFFSSMNGVLVFNKNLTADVILGLTTDKVTNERVFMPNAGIYHTALPNTDVTNESQQLRNSFLQLNTDVRLTYKRIFDYEHDVIARLGFRYQTSDSELDWGKAYNTSSDEMKTLGDGVNALAQIGGSLGNWKSVSNYLNIDYGFQNKYYLSLNAALDGSSRFGKNADGIKMFNNVFGFFPSLTGAWLVSSEDFMQDINYIDVFKIRAGYSVTGNDDIGNYSSRYYYVPQSFLGAYGLVRGNIPNTSLKWETNRKEFIGFDASFLKERLNVSADLYLSKTSDLISIKSISSTSGLGVAIYNDGELQNSGIDLNVTGRIIDRQDLKWDVGLNISTYKNKLIALSDNVKYTEIDGGTIRTQVGSPLAQFYGYQTDGIFISNEDASAAGLKIRNTDGTDVYFKAGDVKFVDQDGDKIISESDKRVIGDANPDFFGSITNRIQWKRFTFNALFTYSVGNDIYNALRSELESFKGTDNQTVAAIYRWKTDGQQTLSPKATWGDPMGNSRFSDRWIEDGSFLRLKSLSVAYDIPFKTGFINAIQVYVTGNNLLTFTNYLGYDPEFSISQNPLSFGIDNCVTPQPVSVLFGVKLGL